MYRLLICYCLLAIIVTLSSCSLRPSIVNRLGKRLNTGEPETFSVCSDRIWNYSGVIIGCGKENESSLYCEQEFQFSVEKAAYWWDASIISSAAGYTKVNLLPFIPFRRKINSPWFALICTIDFQEDFQVFEDPTCFDNPPRVSNNASLDVDKANKCSQSQLFYNKTGTLYCYANDVQMMYGNNSGCLDITIMRTR